MVSSADPCHYCENITGAQYNGCGAYEFIINWIRSRPPGGFARRVYFFAQKTQKVVKLEVTRGDKLREQQEQL
jgi:hypothetical protein